MSRESDAERKAERRAIKRAARRIGDDEAKSLDDAVKWARRRSPESSKSKLARGIVKALRKGQ
jgi:hypothetical protein